MAKTKSNKLQLRHTVLTLLIIVAIAAGIILLQINVNSVQQPNTAPQMTLDPQIAINLTRMPEATPLSGEAADKVSDLKAMVDACADYSPERRRQMEQHITWLLQPATIPADILIALGANPSAKLVFGMATYTSIQWSLADRAPDSCLLPIGKVLNDMLVLNGEAPLPIFAQ